MSGLEGVEPTTGAPYADTYADFLPPGCRCHIREDVDYGDVRVRPPGGCPAHPTDLTALDVAMLDSYRLRVTEHRPRFPQSPA